MFNGVVYQLLWTVLQALEVRVPRFEEGETPDAPLGVTLVVEPLLGGDLALDVGGGWIVDQVKARSDDRHWRLDDLVNKVFPDLFRACREPWPTRCRFVTEQPVQGWQELQGFFQKMRQVDGRFDSEGPLGLGTEPCFSAKVLGRGIGKALRELGEKLSEQGLFCYIRESLRSVESALPDRDFDRRVFHLLRSFEILPPKPQDVVECAVEEALRVRGIRETDLGDKLGALYLDLLNQARRSEGIFLSDWFFRHGLTTIVLDRWDHVCAAASRWLGATLERQRYRPAEDCRLGASPVIQGLRGTRSRKVDLVAGEEGLPVVVRGKSGQGKTWELFRAARELAAGKVPVIWLASSQDPERDCREAARFFCEEIWGHDQVYSLSRLADRVRRIHSTLDDRVWLYVLIDGVLERQYVERLVALNWRSLGIGVAVAWTCDPEHDNSGLDRCSFADVSDFSPEERLDYLKRSLGESFPVPPGDVLSLLARPLLARIYVELSAEGWAPKTEYQLIEAYWSRESAAGLATADRIAEVAAGLLAGRPYPWPLRHLREVGIGDEEFARLGRRDLVRIVQGGRALEIWHDRFLNWAAAEGLVSAFQAGLLSLPDLQSHFLACLDWEQQARRFRYVPMDLLWLLADPARAYPEALTACLEAVEQIAGMGLYSTLQTLGERIVPAIFSRLRAIGEESHLWIRYRETLKRMDPASVSAHALELLDSGKTHFEKIAVQLLGHHGRPEALDKLWNLYCRWYRLAKGAPQEPGGRTGSLAIHGYDQVEGAMRACVPQAAGWVEEALRGADAGQEPVHTLVYLIPKVKAGEELWNRVKAVAFEKVKPQFHRSLIVCIESFYDNTELTWLRQQINREEFDIASMARNALMLLSPSEPVSSVAPVALRGLISTSNWWLPQHQLHRPAETFQLILKLFEEADDPWRVAQILRGRENWMGKDLLNVLLDRLDELLARVLAEAEPSSGEPLYRPLVFLEHLAHPDLLECLWQRAGGTLETRLVDWLLREGPNDSGYWRHDIEAGRTLLGKIAGSEQARMCNGYLETAKTRWGRHAALEMARRHADGNTVELLREISQQDEVSPTSSGTSPIDQKEALITLASLGEDSDVVRGVLRWGLLLPPDFAQHLDGRRMDDEALSPAFAALEGELPPPGAPLAIGFGRRKDRLAAIHDVLRRVPVESKTALGCLVALEQLEDDSQITLDAYRRATEIPEHAFVAKRALRFLRHKGKGEELQLPQTFLPSDLEGLANFLENPNMRREAARRLWERTDRAHLLFNYGEFLEDLGVLGEEAEVKAFLLEQAFSSEVGWGQPAARQSAIRGVKMFAPDAAFDAARHHLGRQDEPAREQYVRLLLDLNPARALPLLAGLLAKTGSFVLIYAIGEELDRTGNLSTLNQWLGDSDAKLREGTCLAAHAVRFEPNLDQRLAELCFDRDWDVREAAWPALESLRSQGELERIVDAIHCETDRARRWALLDAAIQLGYPGILGGWRRWWPRLLEGLPYTMRKSGADRLDKKREELRKELERKER